MVLGIHDGRKEVQPPASGNNGNADGTLTGQKDNLKDKAGAHFYMDTSSGIPNHDPPLEGQIGKVSATDSKDNPDSGSLSGIRSQPTRNAPATHGSSLAVGVCAGSPKASGNLPEQSNPTLSGSDQTVPSSTAAFEEGTQQLPSQRDQSHNLGSPQTAQLQAGIKSGDIINQSGVVNMSGDVAGQSQTRATSGDTDNQSCSETKSGDDIEMRAVENKTKSTGSHLQGTRGELNMLQLEETGDTMGSRGPAPSAFHQMFGSTTSGMSADCMASMMSQFMASGNRAAARKRTHSMTQLIDDLIEKQIRLGQNEDDDDESRPDSSLIDKFVTKHLRGAEEAEDDDTLSPGGGASSNC